MSSIRKILVFRLSSIGDIVLCSGLITALKERFPESQIDFVVKKQFHDLVRFNPCLNKIYLVDKESGIRGLVALKSAIKKEKYDVFFDIHKNVRSLYVRTASNSGTILTFKKNVLKRTLLTCFKIDLYAKYEPVYERFILAGESLGIRVDNIKTSFFTSPEAQHHISALLNSNGIEAKKYVVLVPGASFSNKQWLPHRFAELAARIKAEGTLPVFLGGSKEQDLCTMLAKNSGALSFAGTLSLLESAELLKYAKTVISNDTGMLHLAEAQNVPVVGIYGPTAKQFGFYPILEKSKAVAVDGLSCRPCTKMGMDKCPKGHFKCMKDITVDMVFSAYRDVSLL